LQFAVAAQFDKDYFVQGEAHEVEGLGDGVGGFGRGGAGGVGHWVFLGGWGYGGEVVELCYISVGLESGSLDEVGCQGPNDCLRLSRGHSSGCDCSSARFGVCSSTSLLIDDFTSFLRKFPNDDDNITALVAVSPHNR